MLAFLIAMSFVDEIFFPRRAKSRSFSMKNFGGAKSGLTCDIFAKGKKSDFLKYDTLQKSYFLSKSDFSTQKYRMLDRFLRPKVFHAKTSALCASRKKFFIEKAHRNQKCEQCALVQLLMNPTVRRKSNRCVINSKTRGFIF